jgi:hypothetical protein
MGRRLVLAITVAPVLVLLVWGGGWLVMDMIRYHRGISSAPARTFTVARATSEPDACKGYGCWYDYSTLYDERGRHYTYEGYKVEPGSKCTTHGHTRKIASCSPQAGHGPV